MKKKDRIYRLFLEDMLLAMNRVAEYIDGLNFTGFKHDYKTVDAVIRNFEVIGEASKSMLKEIKDKYPMVPWDEMYLMRNKISHEYFGVDYEILWDVASNYLPANKLQIEDILKKEQ
jgi:uncharacterized protein with HEPN domain